MKILYFITGTSSGIGYALTNHILANQTDIHVHGISRKRLIHHQNYTHHTLDLADLEDVNRFFDELKISKKEALETQKVVLINNAGTLGEVGYVGKLDNKDIVQTMTINTLSPFLLMNEFLKKFGKETYINANKKSVPLEKLIINISSGAGKRPIDGWASYCASKAGLNLFSEVIKEEEKHLNQNTHVFNISVGVVDTNMQAQIRKTEESQFSNVEYFKELKKNNELASPTFIAGKIYSIIEQPQNFEDIWQKLQ
ncbi:SDR family NAD(P)-dependent oxidoreductase [Bernardetia sp. OM2101]|uniref:SDR family NAD(P)-dependent oxidoreductase n=1 Tax=Bernardetia sp. OM2101 TaxID=3344876 RepID=UPI0035D09E4D